MSVIHFSVDTNDLKSLMEDAFIVGRAMYDLRVSEDEVLPVTAALGRMGTTATYRGLSRVASPSAIGDSNLPEATAEEVIHAIAQGPEAVAVLEETKAIPWLLVAKFIFEMIQLFRKR